MASLGGRPAMLASCAATLGLAVIAVMALGGGQALAAPLSCGDKITTDTTLHKDLVNCPHNGIIIGADDITLDLNGHTIDGDGISSPTCECAVWSQRHDGV